MAASVTVNDKTIAGNKRISFATVTLDSSYPTGGESVTASQLGLSSVHAAIATVKSATGGGVNVANAHYDVATSKILVYDETPAQVADTSDLSATVINIVAFGN